MKYSLIILYFFAHTVFSGCPELELAIDLNVEELKGTYQSSPNHRALNEYVISLNSNVGEYRLNSIELTQGEVLELIAPLAIKISESKSVARITTSEETAKTFELFISYSNEKCSQSYHKRLL